MCGRFALTLPVDAMARLFAARPDNDLPELPDHNICPSSRIAVVLAGERQQDDSEGTAPDTAARPARRLRAMRWGFVPRWYKAPTDGPLLINARGETLATKPAFRDAARLRRCLIPVSGFYEWTRDPGTGARLPWYISPCDGAVMCLAGIWQGWGAGDARLMTCAIVTTAAGPDVAHLHDRQPVILPPAAQGLWLGEEGHGAARLMRPSDGGTLRAWRVGTAVNSNRARGAGLSEPITS